MASLDPVKCKQLIGEQPSNSSSTISLNSLGRSGPSTPAHGTEKGRSAGSGSSQYGYVSVQYSDNIDRFEFKYLLINFGSEIRIYYYTLLLY